jgi:alpha-ribazole phosphatase
MKHVFIRHPPLPGMQGICYGTLDVKITQAIVLQNADTLKKALPFLPVISSPLQRCFSLAQAISLDTKKDIRLIEMNFGDWQGRKWDSIDRPALDAWARDVTKFRAPNGENFIDVVNRLAEFLHELTQPHIVVTHAGVIRAGHYLSGAMPIEQAAALEIPYGVPIIIPV